MARAGRAELRVAPAGGDGARRVAGLTCVEVADALPALLDGPVRARGRNGRRVAAHVEQCLRCQAELAQYRKLLRSLRTLRDDVLPPTDGPLTAVLDSVAAAGEAHAVRAMLTGRRAAYVAGVATVVSAAAAGGVAAFVLTRRPKRP